MKPIITSRPHILLENWEQLSCDPIDEYAGFIYIWKCIPESMYYVGSHKGPVTSRYDGSGRRFTQALRHYGITQFQRAILEYVQSEDLVRHREQHWIDTFRAVRSDNFYNVKNAIRL